MSARCSADLGQHRIIIHGIYTGYIWLYRDNGEENGNYYDMIGYIFHDFHYLTFVLPFLRLLDTRSFYELQNTENMSKFLLLRLIKTTVLV